MRLKKPKDLKRAIKRTFLGIVIFLVIWNVGISLAFFAGQRQSSKSCQQDSDCKAFGSSGQCNAGCYSRKPWLGSYCLPFDMGLCLNAFLPDTQCTCKQNQCEEDYSKLQLKGIP